MMKLLKLWIRTLFQTWRSLEWLGCGLLALVLAGSTGPPGSPPGPSGHSERLPLVGRGTLSTLSMYY